MATTDIIDYLEVKKNLLGLPKRAKILDFGCGKGELVAKLRELGFDAHGVDISILWEARMNGACHEFLPGYRIPFKDEEFDLVVSTSVMEHVQNKQDAFLEIYRILKPGGYAAHAFPSKFFFPLEPHIKVPFVSWFRFQASKYYLTVFALLGFRNIHQQDLSWREVRDANFVYVRDGLSYWTRRRYLESLVPIYSASKFDEAYAGCGGGAVARIDRKIRNRRLRTIWRRFATLFRNQLLLCKK